MSGRDELLDKAIADAKEAEDWQLVEWLRMARGSERAARWYSDKLREAHRTERKLLDENANLRERVAELEELLPDSGRWYRAETVEAYVAEIDKLRELVDYMAPIALYGASEQERDRMRELGVEVSE